MHDEDLLPDCGRIQGELASFLYDELAPDARGALERHLAGCGACRDELQGMRDTHALLARWETPVVHEDPRMLARLVAAEARAEELPAERAAESLPPQRRRLLRWSAFATGAAAAVLFTLSLLQARATYEQGRFQLSFALPGVRAVDAPALGSEGDPAWAEERMRAIAAQEVAREVAACAASFEQSQLRLAQTIDYAFAQNQERWDTRLVDLGVKAARADLETRRVLTDLASYLPVSHSNR